MKKKKRKLSLIKRSAERGFMCKLQNNLNISIKGIGIKIKLFQ